MAKHFTSHTFQFFRDLGENNHKEWFDEHKPVYDNHVYIPLKELVTTMSPTMHSIDDQFELRPHRAVSRIYRDVRFSKDKSPYKTCMWLSFQRPMPREEWLGYPGYFFEITAEGYMYGMGLFQPKKKQMDAFREEITYVQEEFRKQGENLIAKGFSIGGEMYKRPLPSELDNWFQPWVQRKGVYLFKSFPVDERIASPDFHRFLAEEFMALEWMYNFMKEVVEL